MLCIKYTTHSHIYLILVYKQDFRKNSNLVILFQSLKCGVKSDVDNYRPISLVSTLSKILEKAVATNLMNYLQLNKIIHPHQFGFQRNISTEHNLLHVTNLITNAINNDELN